MTNFFIGTSGWSYEHWDSAFYPQIPSSKRLSFYSEIFSTVEINTTFYHLPTEKAVQNWKSSTPKDFIFSVKASRYITHIKKLKDPKESVEKFLKMASFLKKKLGPILFQLPPSFKTNLERLEDFIQILPKKQRYCFEFRHPSWFNEQTYEVLKKYNIALCISDLNGALTPLEMTAKFVYIRLHGPKSAYRGSYQKKTLQNWAKRIKEWMNQNRDVYCYFDNDEKGYAPKDASMLKKLMVP